MVGRTVSHYRIVEQADICTIHDIDEADGQRFRTMTRRLPVAVVVVLAILVAGVVHGQQVGASAAANAAPLPDARTIIDWHNQAIGGRAAILGDRTATSRSSK